MRSTPCDARCLASGCWNTPAGRGPRYKGFSKGGHEGTGGHKALFRLGDYAMAARVVVAESAIDALSMATLEGWPETTVYVSTGGGFGANIVDAFNALFPATARLAAATDEDAGGTILADRLFQITRNKRVAYRRLRPTAKDWNAQRTGISRALMMDGHTALR
jgi:hypothetical protein